MKKLTIIALVVAVTAVFAVSASANEWNLYGSTRMATYWTSQDYGGNTEDDWGRGTVNELQWQLQANSRVGATVKGDQLEGRFEFSVTSDGSSGNVGSRRLYGIWKFTEGWGLKVGKDYTPMTFFLSGQVFDNDQGLLQVGNAYGARRAQIAVEGMLGPGMLKAALIQATADDLPREGTFLDFNTTTESKFPKVEVSYEWKLSDAMSFHGFAGWQTYKQLQETVLNIGGVDVTQQLDDTVNSYMFGAGADLNFGPMYVKPQASWYKNGASAGWLSTNLGLGGPINPVTGNPISQVPYITSDGTVVDQDSIMVMLALGFSPTEALTLEAGGGWLRMKDDNDNKNNYLEYYIQAVWKMAPSVYLVPEIGYRDYGKLETGSGLLPDVDLGGLFYAGAKWQIDF